MSKRISRRLIFTGIVMIVAIAAGFLYLEGLKAERTVVFQIHSSVSSEFATLIGDNPEFLDGVRLCKHSAGPDLWEFQVPIRLNDAQAMERKELTLDRLRDWLGAETSISPQIGLVVHSGAENTPIERTDEWPARVVELLSEGASRGRDELDK